VGETKLTTQEKKRPWPLQPEGEREKREAKGETELESTTANNYSRRRGDEWVNVEEGGEEASPRSYTRRSGITPPE